jgi:hypothetical protein
VNARWDALVRYDDEIRAAAEQLRPYGNYWVAKLGDAFFELDQDRRYLPNMIVSLTEDAKEAHEHARELHEHERERIARAWLKGLERTADGEATTEESLNILIGLHNLGYEVSVEGNGAFAVSECTSTSLFYSNHDIQRIGPVLLARHRDDVAD